MAADNRLRILYLTDGFPYPLLSGRLRHYHFIRHLAKSHDVTLLSTVAANHPVEHEHVFAGVVTELRTFPSERLSHSVRARVPERLVALFSDVSDRGVRNLVQAARRIHAGRPFDIVLNARVEAALSRHLAEVPVVVDLCDAFSTLTSTQLALAPWRDRPRLRAKLQVVRRVEERLTSTATRLLVSTEQEAQRVLSQHPSISAPITIVPNGVDTSYWRRSSPNLGDAIVFSGALNYPPNEAAALALIEDIMPRVLRDVPGAKLIVAGRDPTRRIQRAARRRNDVELTGLVDDLRPHLEQGAIFAAPLWFGAGIQNKLLEAMAMEMPIVTVPSAAAGVSAADGRLPPVRLARTPTEFADVIIEAVTSTDRRPHSDLRRFVDVEFSWDSATRRLDDELHAAMAIREQPASD